MSNSRMNLHMPYKMVQMLLLQDYIHLVQLRSPHCWTISPTPCLMRMKRELEKLGFPDRMVVDKLALV